MSPKSLIAFPQAKELMYRKEVTKQHTETIASMALKATVKKRGMPLAEAQHRTAGIRRHLQRQRTP